jgi:class 3 adenylate cyclase/tetratricopeptide (TPR) repeat protein
LIVQESTGVLDRYVPRVLLRRLLSDTREPVVTHDGTLVFVDVSGFTKLSERLARSGKEGAERLVDVINTCFSALLADAYANGGSLLKFGGDALLLWFEGEGHVPRGCASAAAMQNTLRRVGRIDTGGHKVVLRMSVGVHSGPLDMFLVGGSHREFLIAGPTASRVVEMEGVASAGQILVSPETAARLPPDCLGAPLEPGVLLARAPVGSPPPAELPARPADDVVAGCLSTVVRAHVMAPESEVPEHRMATIAFILFGNLDKLIEEQGREAAAQALEQVVCTAQEAADRYGVCFQDSDLASGGGKLILTAGAPRRVGDDEERMLLALRQVIEADTPLPLRIGVNRGQVFAGEIGPPYRKTYTAMGDTTNLAARLMARAPWGSIYATRGVLDLSKTQFETTEIEPFMVKGKSRPVQAWELGPVKRASLPAGAGRRLPLVGRDREMAVLEAAIRDASAGSGTMVELVGDTGSGKSRLLAEAREIGSGMRFVHTTCEAYTKDIPYIGWRDPIRQLLGLSWDDPGELALERLRSQVEATQPELLPWLPLLAIVVDAPCRNTPEVDTLAPEKRLPKLHEVVIEFLRPALKEPTQVQVEHAHLMDQASAALLESLAGELRSSAWIVLVSRRDVEEGFVAPAATAKRLQLKPLSAADAMALAEAAPEADTILPHMLQLAVDRADGSPEFLLDLLAAAAGGSTSLPDSVDGAASARIDALDPGDRTLVQRAAVLGMVFHENRLRDVLPEGASMPDRSAWRRLTSVFARDDDGHIRFKRPALQEVAYENLPFRLRRELHANVARALEPSLGQDVDADPAILSRHFELAGDNAWAWTYAILGAERAKERFAQVDAAHLYRRAINAGRSTEVKPDMLAAAWEELGEALRISGELASAVEAFTAARRLIPGDAVAQARLFYRHADVAERRERLVAAVRWAKRGLRALQGVSSGEAASWRVQLLSRLAGLRERQGRQLEAERLCREAIPAAERIGERRALAYLYFVLDTALFRSGRLAEPANWERALEIYRELDDPENESKVLNNMGMVAHMEGRWDEVVELLEEVAACSQRAGNPADAAVSDLNIGEIRSDQGRSDEAAVRLRRARRVFSSTGDRQILAHLNLTLGRLWIRQGQRDEGIALIAQAAADLRQFGLDQVAAYADALLVEAWALAGNAERALALADRQLESAEAPPPLLRRARGLALAQLDDREAATHELELAAAVAREHGEQYELALALDALEQLDGPDSARETERDAILERLDVVRLPEQLTGKAHVELVG